MLNSHITYCIYSSQYLAHADRNTRSCPVYLKAKVLNGPTRYFVHFTDIILRAPATYICFHISLCVISSFERFYTGKSLVNQALSSPSVPKCLQPISTSQPGWYLSKTLSAILLAAGLQTLGLA